MSLMSPEAPHGCPRCSRPTRDHAYVCDTCLDELTQALAECPWTADELAVTTTGQKGIDYSKLGGSPSSEVRIPVHLGASDATDRLRTTLTTWVAYCHGNNVRHQSPNPDIALANIAAMSRYLMWRVDGLAFHKDAPDAVDQITGAVNKAKQVIDRPVEKWFVGPCPQCGAGIYAPVGADTATCRTPIRALDTDTGQCGFSVDVKKRREQLLTQAEDRLATATEIATAVSWLGAAPLTPAKVRGWVFRGRLVAKGHDGKNPTYRIGDAIDLLSGTAQETSA